MILPQTNREPSLERVYHWEHLRHQWQFITKFQLFLQGYTFCCNIGNVTPLQIRLECWLKETLVSPAASIFCYSSSDTLPCSISHQDLVCNSSTQTREGESLPLKYNNCTKLRRGIEKGRGVSSCWEHCTLNIETLLSCQDQYAFPSSPLIHTRTQKSMTSNEYVRSSRTVVSRGTIESIFVAWSLELWETSGRRHPQKISSNKLNLDWVFDQA